MAGALGLSVSDLTAAAAGFVAGVVTTLAVLRIVTSAVRRRLERDTE